MTKRYKQQQQPHLYSWNKMNKQSCCCWAAFSIKKISGGGVYIVCHFDFFLYAAVVTAPLLLRLLYRTLPHVDIQSVPFPYRHTNSSDNQKK